MKKLDAFALCVCPEIIFDAIHSCGMFHTKKTGLMDKI
jgi:hypothetical protein